VAESELSKSHLVHGFDSGLQEIVLGVAILYVGMLFLF